MYLALVLIDLQLLLAELAFHVRQFLLLRLYQIAKFSNAIVILELVFGNDQAATLLAQHWSLRIVFALLQVGRQTVQLDDRVAAVHNIVAIDAQTCQKVPQDPGDCSKLSRCDRCAIQGTGRLTVYPFIDTGTTKGMLAYWCLQHIRTYLQVLIKY